MTEVLTIAGAAIKRIDETAFATTQNITVHAVDLEKGLILLKGAIPGPKGGLLVLRSAAKKNQEA